MKRSSRKSERERDERNWRMRWETTFRGSTLVKPALLVRLETFRSLRDTKRDGPRKLSGRPRDRSHCNEIEKLTAITWVVRCRACCAIRAKEFCFSSNRLGPYSLTSTDILYIDVYRYLWHSVQTTSKRPNRPRESCLGII